MKNIIKGLSILLLVLVMESCSDKQGKQISAVIPIAENKQDSALDILNKIDQTKPSDKDIAMYSLVYTMAQDKSGLDVDNDSLLCNALIGTRISQQTAFMPSVNTIWASITL